jgi:hypothetical protein
MSFDKLSKKIQAAIQIQKSLMDDIGKLVTKNVKTRTRRGFGVTKEGGSSTKLVALSDPYKKRRKQLKAQGKLSPETTPAKSNLTRTGAMVDSLEYTIDKETVTISVTGAHNKTKAKEQGKRGRVFMNLNKREIKDIADVIKKAIGDNIKKQGL